MIDKDIKVIHVWTDSTTILSWIQNHSIHPPKFVSRRLQKLSQLKHHFSSVNWHHIPTEFNAAEIASHGLNIRRDGKNRVNLWLHRPAFFSFPNQWSPEPKAEIMVLDENPICGDQPPRGDAPDTLISYHSSMDSLCRDVAVWSIYKQFLIICQATGHWPGQINWKINLIS